MAENISDVNTEDEENMKETRHDRAAAKNSTSEDESSGTEVDSGLLPVLPDPKGFSGSQKLFHSNKSAQILATYEHPTISEKDIKTVRHQKVSIIEKRKPKIIQQETKGIAKNKELEDKSQQDFINNDNSNEFEELITHLNKNEDQSQKG